MFSLGGGRAAFLGSKNTYLPTFAPPIYLYMFTKIENRVKKKKKKKNSCKHSQKRDMKNWQTGVFWT
jgi:hypothetical protein